MRVVSLRRYPVKSMGGESLDRVVVDARGLAGDRWWAVEDEDGRLASGKDSRRFRRRDPVFDFTARTNGSTVVVTGPWSSWEVQDPALGVELSRAMGATVRLTTEAAVPHQDAAAVSLVGTASLDWCARRWGGDPDPRRLRANIVVATDEPFVEETWAGRVVQVGSTRLRVVDRAPRCRMIDIDQDGVVAAGAWLKALAAERDMCLAVYADVAAPGAIGLDDEVRVLPD
jgi:uncharacterized protein YcbX